MIEYSGSEALLPHPVKNSDEVRKAWSFYALCLFVLTFPMLEGYSNATGGGGTTLLGLLLAVVWLIESLLRRRVRLNQGLVILTLFCIWMVCTSLWSENDEISIGLIFSYVMIFAFYLIVQDVLTSRSDIRMLIAFYLVGVGVLASTAFVNIGAMNTYAELSNRYSADGTDPNNFGMMLATAIPLLLFASDQASARVKVLAIVVMAAVAYLILATASRASAICLVFGMSGFLLRARNPRQMWLALFSLSLLAVLFLIFVIQYIPEAAYERLIGGVKEIGADDRFKIWGVIFGDSGHFFQGLGAGVTFDVLGIQAHSTFASAFFEGGLVGASLWVVFWLIHAKYMIKALRFPDKRMTVYLFLSYLILLVAASSLNWEFRKPLYVLMAIYSSWLAVQRRESVMRSASS